MTDIDFSLYLSLLLITLSLIVRQFRLIRLIQKPNFRLRKRYLPREKPINSDYGIIIDSLDKTIERCRILYNGKPLPWGEREDPKHEKIIGAGLGGIVRIPRGEENDDAEITVMDGRKTLKRIKYRDLVRAN